MFLCDNQAKKKILLFPEMWVTKNIFTRAAVKRKLLQQHFSWLKNKEPYLLLFEGKKRKFLRINLLVEIFW